jgi:hypothetical protein
LFISALLLHHADLHVLDVGVLGTIDGIIENEIKDGGDTGAGASTTYYTFWVSYPEDS